MATIQYVDLFKSVHMYKMMDTLRINGECMQDEIDKKSCNNHYRTPAKLKLLEEVGIVTHRIGKSNNNDHKACFWKLTPKGMALAECLETGRKIFTGEMKVDSPEEDQ